MAWKKLEITIPETGTGDLAEIIDKIRQFVEALVNVLETILNFIVAITDPIAELIRALIEKLKETVEGFLEDLGGYVLYVPIRKRLMTNFLGLGDITPSWADKLGVFNQDYSPIAFDDPELGEFIVNSNRYNGGNGGFYRTFLESLYDEGDTNRPQFFNEDDHVGGVVLVMGTGLDPLGFLDDIWKLIGMFDGPDTTPKVPRPKGLQVRTLSHISSGVFDALLTWDAPEVPIYQLDDLGGLIMYPERYAIIRVKNDCSALSAANIIDLMGKRDVQAGDTFNNGNAVVLVEEEYNFTKSTYLDENIEAGTDDSFYYAVAWQLKAYNAGADINNDVGSSIPYWQISNVARAIPFPTLPASTPPDWVRTPSVADIFPQFAKLLRRLVAQIENFANKLLAGTDLIREYVEFLKKEIARYEYIVNQILDELAKLQAKLDLPKTGVYTRTFKGQGGNNYLLTDLARSLLPDYPNAPPFHKGDEYVTGVIIMTGGPDVEGYEQIIDTFITNLSWIFGGGDGEDEMAVMLSQLGEAVTEMEDHYFGPDMQVTEEPTEIVFDAAFVPTNCNPSESVEAFFSPNMEVLSADDV